MTEKDKIILELGEELMRELRKAALKKKTSESKCVEQAIAQWLEKP